MWSSLLLIYLKCQCILITPTHQHKVDCFPHCRDLFQIFVYLKFDIGEHYSYTCIQHAYSINRFYSECVTRRAILKKSHPVKLHRNCLTKLNISSIVALYSSLFSLLDPLIKSYAKNTFDQASYIHTHSASL